jgi:integrase/recombinase XerD
MSNPPTLAGLLESFFRRRLVEQRNATVATVAAYRDALRLLILYASENVRRPPCELSVTDLDRARVLDFLDHLERHRGNGPSTRNARLTAIRSFFRHVAASDPASIGVAQRVLAIPTKRTVAPIPGHLGERELKALLDGPDRQMARGRRDYALLLFLVRTGARVSEAVGVDAADLRLERPEQVMLRGKGRKLRVIPLAADIARVMRDLCRERGLGPDDHRPVFVGARKERLTRFGATHVVRRAVRVGTRYAPGLARARVSPHLLRHTLAMRLLRSGSDLITIQAWLGHAQVSTTHRYAEADVEMMRKSLELTGVSSSPSGRYRPKDSVLQILENQ